MDDTSTSTARAFRLLILSLVVLTFAGTGCSTYIGTTAKSFLGHVRNNPDPNIRFQAYSKLASKDSYDNQEQMAEAVDTLMAKFEKGREPVAIRAIICRTLGELGDSRARELLIKASSDPEGVIRVEACRSLGKVGRPEDAPILARIMTIDNLEDVRIAAIEGLAEIKSQDARIFKVLLDGMDHEDPAIRLASLNALRKITRKDVGVETEAWRKELKPVLDADPSTASPEVQKASTEPAQGGKGREERR